MTKPLHRFHRLGITHGDVNGYNLIFDHSMKHARLTDIEHAAPYEEFEGLAELQLLPAQLAEETRRGGPAIIVSGDDE